MKTEQQNLKKLGLDWLKFKLKTNSNPKVYSNSVENLITESIKKLEDMTGEKRSYLPSEMILYQIFNQLSDAIQKEINKRLKPVKDFISSYEHSDKLIDRNTLNELNNRFLEQQWRNIKNNWMELPEFSKLYFQKLQDIAKYDKQQVKAMLLIGIYLLIATTKQELDDDDETTIGSSVRGEPEQIFWVNTVNRRRKNHNQLSYDELVISPTKTPKFRSFYFFKVPTWLKKILSRLDPKKKSSTQRPTQRNTRSNRNNEVEEVEEVEKSQSKWDLPVTNNKRIFKMILATATQLIFKKRISWEIFRKMVINDQYKNKRTFDEIDQYARDHNGHEGNVEIKSYIVAPDWLK
eukprot:Pgem_evm2s6834